MKLISHIKQLVTLAHLFFLPLAAFAQTNGITISNFAAAPGKEDAPTTLTFNIQWEPRSDGQVWSDTVWVFVDYNNKGTMTRLPLATGATLTNPSWDGAEVIEVPGNDKGVWVVGNARATQGAFTATVQLVETWRATSLHGLCIYAINYPPRAQYTDDGNIKLNGTPPFYLTYSNGSAATVTADKAMSTITLTGTLASFTDASLAPGVINCKTPAQQTLQSSATVYCADGAGVTLSLSNTEKGAIYRLWKGDDDAGSVTGNGSAMTFTNQHQKGTYTATVEATAQFCAATLTSRVTVTEVTQPAEAGLPPNACGCAPESADCQGTCTTNHTVTVYSDECAGCGKANVKKYKCGVFVENIDTYDNSTCRTQQKVFEGYVDLSTADSSCKWRCDGRAVYMGACGTSTCQCWCWEYDC